MCRNQFLGELIKMGAKTLLQLTISKQDNDVKSIQTNRRNDKKNQVYDRATLQWQSIVEKIPGIYLHATIYDKEDQVALILIVT